MSSLGTPQTPYPPTRITDPFLIPLTASAAEATIFEKEELFYVKRVLRLLRDLRECMRRKKTCRLEKLFVKNINFCLV